MYRILERRLIQQVRDFLRRTYNLDLPKIVVEQPPKVEGYYPKTNPIPEALRDATTSKLTAKVESGKTEISPVMHELATYIFKARKAPLPKPIVEKTKHHVLDTIAAMVSGSKLLPGEMAISYIKTQGGTAEATAMATGRNACPRTIRLTAPRCAPSAIRMPISAVRCVTAYDSTP